MASHNKRAGEVNKPNTIESSNDNQSKVLLTCRSGGRRAAVDRTVKISKQEADAGMDRRDITPTPTTACASPSPKETKLELFTLHSKVI